MAFLWRKKIVLSNTWGKGWCRGWVGASSCEENEIRRLLCEVSRRRGRDEHEVNIKLGLEQNHLFLCFCFCSLALLELIPLISASKLVIVQSTAYVRLLWKGCRGKTSSTLPQSQPQSVQLPLRDDLVSNFCPLICIFIFRSNWESAVCLKDMQ